jgi:hypothetical protein
MGDSKRDCWTLGTESLNQIEKQAESGWSKVFFHHPKSRRLAWPKQLVLECAENPVSGPMLAGSRYYGKIGFPSLLDQSRREDGFIANGHVEWSEKDRDYQRMEVLLFTASTYAPTLRDWKWLPLKARQEAVETWRRTPYANSA